MKRFFVCFAVLTAMILAVSCDSGLKFNNPNDPNNQAKVQQGELNGECYPNKTCNEGLTCDKENNICLEVSGKTNDSDKTDSDAENGDEEDDTPCTEGSFKCHGAFVSYICHDGEWSHFKECGIDEICNDETGECENPDLEHDTPDSSDSVYDPTDSSNTSNTDFGDTDSGDTADTEGDTDSGCTPNCGSKECGSDGCGSVCGMCGDGKRCNISTFVCECLPNCDGKTCGDDGCGRTCKCQNAGDVCNPETKICECVPNCGGKVCGSDGCGGKCGEGCGYDQMCNADQTGCDTCTDITLKDLVQTASSDPANRFYDYTAEYTPNNGGNTKNHFSFRMYNPPYDYIKFDELPFNTCTGDKPNNANNACAFIKEYEGDLITKLYYPQKGILTITWIIPKQGTFSAPVAQQPILVEVDKVTGEVVPGGQCYRVTNNPINAKGK